MREVLIPNDMHPFVITINGVEYRYPEGTTQNVPDDVAAAIDAYKGSVLPAKPNSVFDSEGLSFQKSDAGHALMVNNEGTDVIWQEPVANLDAAIELAQEAKADAEDAQEAAEDAADRAESAAETLELDATLTSATKAAQAKAVGDEIAVEDEKINALYGQVNYGYNISETLAPDPNSNKNRIGIARTLTRIILNGATDSNNCYIKISNAIDRSANTTGVKAFTNPISLVNGHLYRYKLKVLSGTYTTQGSFLSPIPSVYRSGEAASVGEITVTTATECIREFTADGSTYHVCVYVDKNNTSVTNLVCEVTLEDVTVGSIIQELMTVPEGSAWS